jgi:hypothetical protein
MIRKQIVSSYTKALAAARYEGRPSSCETTGAHSRELHCIASQSVVSNCVSDMPELLPAK